MREKNSRDRTVLNRIKKEFNPAYYAALREVVQLARDINVDNTETQCEIHWERVRTKRGWKKAPMRGLKREFLHRYAKVENPRDEVLKVYIQGKHKRISSDSLDLPGSAITKACEDIEEQMWRYLWRYAEEFERETLEGRRREGEQMTFGFLEYTFVEGAGGVDRNHYGSNVVGGIVRDIMRGK